MGDRKDRKRPTKDTNAFRNRHIIPRPSTTRISTNLLSRFPTHHVFSVRYSRRFTHFTQRKLQAIQRCSYHHQGWQIPSSLHLNWILPFDTRWFFQPTLVWIIRNKNINYYARTNKQSTLACLEQPPSHRLRYPPSFFPPIFSPLLPPTLPSKLPLTITPSIVTLTMP